MQPNLTISTLKKLLATQSDGLLYQGHHDPPNGDCKMCVRELRCLALGMDEWTDLPDGGSQTDLACQILNDSPWSSDAARTEACLPLALLSEKTAPDGWTARYMERTIREILPIALRMAAEKMGNSDHQRALLEAAERCECEGSRDSAIAARAAADAAWAAQAADAAWAAQAAAADAAWAAADAAWAAAAARAAARAADDGDQVLRKAVQILMDCHGVR